MIPDLGSTRETFWTQIKVHTDSTRDPKSVYELRAVVTIVPEKFYSNTQFHFDEK